MADQTLPNNWHVPRWIKVLGIIIAVIAFIALILFVTGNGDKLQTIATSIWDLLKSVWLWIVGFAGGILALFQRDGKKPGINEVKKEIKQENEQIGLELDGLRKSMDDVDKWRERERTLHEREISLLERELNLKEQLLQIKEASIQEILSQSGKEFVDSLPENRRDEIRNTMEGSEIDL